MSDTAQNLPHALYAVDLNVLPQLYAAARREERGRICAAAIDRILELADDVSALRDIGARFSILALEGTLPQQFCCRLAADLGSRTELPDFVRTAVVKPLIEALRIVLRVGAPSRQHAAIEGLGALLKHFDDPAAEFPLHPPAETDREWGESDSTHDVRQGISEQFFVELRRHRLMVLAIAGDETSRKEFSYALAQPIADVLANSAEYASDVLQTRSDLLRAVLAVVHQNGGPRLPLKPADLLTRAAQLPAIQCRDSPEVVIAFARYRESVFRTIDTALRRGWKWKKFDEVVAAAVRAIPRTMAGSPAMCNAEIRATVATLRTAIYLLRRAGADASSTRSALEPLFENLRDQPTPWANHGIAEGCFRGLPDLVGNPLYDDIVRFGIAVLFAEMQDVPAQTDLLKTHRRLLANACFRGILRSLARHLEEQQLRLLLHDPTPETLWRTLQRGHVPAEGAQLAIGEPIIAGIAFESELLRRSSTLSAPWPELSTIERVLLVRILSILLHGIARDLPKLRHHDVLWLVFAETPGVSLGEDEALRLSWELLSSIPAEAADVASVEIQRFAEEGGKRHHGRGFDESLPGYVLAMVSPVASGQVASAIAREIDLHLRRERAVSPHADFATTLYQITLRGPHETVFDHLLPRLDETEDRSITMLFRRAVADARSWTNEQPFDRALIHKHVRQLLMDLERQKSRFLQDLRRTLILYVKLTESTEEGWKCIAQGDVIRLFRGFDELAKQADGRGPRIALTPRYGRELSRIQEEVTRYIALPIRHFTARTETLTTAGEITEHLEHVLRTEAGLCGPEHVLLIALMQHFHELFDSTVRWYCKEPRQLMDRAEDENARIEFWRFFCDPASSRLESPAELLRSGPGKVNVLGRFEAEEQIARFHQRMGEPPPPFPGQRQRFENLFIEWLTSIGDLDTIEKALHPRWPAWLRALRSILVSTGVVVSIVAICTWAAVMDAMERHWLEGAGFLVVLTIVGSASVAVVAADGVRNLLAWFRRRRRDIEPRASHWFAALLPATPIALSVGFDHSYDLPLHGSTWVLLFVLVMSYLGARLVVMREIAARDRTEVAIASSIRKKVSRRINLSLAYSFAAAVLISAIFSSSYDHADHADHKPPLYTVAGSWPKTLDLLAVVLHRFDEIPAEHQHPRFIGVLPREVVFDFSRFLTLPPEVAGHALFVFYPTVILTWTALGLFFGVFLEGVLKRTGSGLSDVSMES